MAVDNKITCNRTTHDYYQKYDEYTLEATGIEFYDAEKLVKVIIDSVTMMREGGDADVKVIISGLEGDIPSPEVFQRTPIT